MGLDLSDEKVNYAVDYRDAFPFYVNNLDTDKKYKQWGNSVKLMLQPYYPGMIRPIARNLFNLVSSLFLRLNPELLRSSSSIRLIRTVGIL